MQAAAETNYRHREGRGSRREKVVRDFLERRIPNSCLIGKGHVQDSECRQTSEFDIVIYNPAARLVISEAESDRCTYPVECVRALIEVRTTIDAGAIQSVAKKVEELSLLKRKYLQTYLSYRVFGELGHEDLPSATEIQSPFNTIAIPVYLFGFQSAISENKACEKYDAQFAASGILCLSQYYINFGSFVDGQREIVCAGTDLVGGKASLALWLADLTSQISSSIGSDLLNQPYLNAYFRIPKSHQVTRDT